MTIGYKYLLGGLGGKERVSGSFLKLVFLLLCCIFNVVSWEYIFGFWLGLFSVLVWLLIQIQLCFILCYGDFVCAVVLGLGASPLGSPFLGG